MLTVDTKVKPDQDSHELIREKYIQINKGLAVVVSDSMLDSLMVRSVRSNFALEIVSIPNPSQIGAKDGLLAGYISAPEIERYRLHEGLECRRQVELMHEISKVSGLTLNEIYSFRESITNIDEGVRIDALEKSLKNWQWRAMITKMTTNIKELDLSNKDGLMRAIQIQMSEERKRSAIKYANKYYADYSETRDSEIKKAEDMYAHDLSNPQMVCNGLVADAILSKNAKYLVDMFTKGLFCACEKVFGMATGVKIVRLSKVNKEAALIEWAARTA